LDWDPEGGRSNSLRWGSGFLDKTGVFFKGGLFPIEGVAGRRGGWRRPVPGLEGEQLPAAALDGGEGGQGGGRVEGAGRGYHNTTLVRFLI
jgi:hypothetical protein